MSTPVDPVKLRLDYAWNWFSYHAGQRFAAFNFFVVVVGAEVVGYAQAATNGSGVLGTGIGFLGAFFAFGLLMIDIRNEQLVDCGRRELEKLEREDLHVSISIAAQERRNEFISHAFWLRTVLGGSGVISFLAGLWALSGFSSF